MRSIFLLALFTSLNAQSPADLDFTKPIGELRDLPLQLPAALRAQAEQFLSQRPQLSNAAALQARAQLFRNQLLSNIGGLPQQTPLNPRITGTIDRQNFKIEKIIFESQPNFFVTANLYLPKTGKAPYPAILFPLGHEPGAKAHEAWQYVLGSLATKGFVALAWDPAGQGERVQFFDPDTRASRLPRATSEHSMLGVQTLVTGESFARYTIHDGLRALDYLASRPEVDPARIGITGNSGGGTHTAYLAALDPRLKVAAPSCYITSWSRLLAQLGPQDAEQNLPPFLNLGFDFPDFLYAFAPKPYLVLSAIRDFFPIAGARATFSEAQKVYDSLGQAEKIKMVEADDGHGYTLPRRLAAYAWFSQWLKGTPDDGIEPQFPLATEAELQCTPTGQLATSLGGETVFTLNQKRARQLAAANPADVIRHARELSAYQAPQSAPRPTPYGTLHYPTHRIEKFVYQPEPGVQIPAILAIPNASTAKRSAVLYVHGAGKSAIASKLPAHIAAGEIVMAIDLRGLGELTPEARANDPNLGDASTITLALLLGRTYVGMRAQDIAGAAELLAAHPNVDPARIRLVASGRAAVPALYAAAFQPRIHSTELHGLLKSYLSIVENRFHRHVFEHVVPGAIRHYDLPDLVKATNARVVSTVDALGH
jgi:cephalosporin-C deacetylase-like acetyl esterase